MCNERNHSICYTTTTYKVGTFKNKNKRNHWDTFLFIIFFSFISVCSQLQICYNRNTLLRHSIWWERNELINQSKDIIGSGWKQCSITKVLLKNVTIFTGKYLCWSLFFNKEILSNFIKKMLKHRCFLVNIAEFLGSPVLKNIYERLPLSNVISKWSI